MKEAIVLFPCAAFGHLVPMVELGKLLVTRRPSLSVHFLVASHAFKGGSPPEYLPTISSAAAAATAVCPSLTFHYLTANLPPDYSSSPSPHFEAFVFDVHRQVNPEVRQTLISISNNHHVLGLVIDFFCTAAYHVAEELSIPCYYFFPSGAGIVSFHLYHSTIHEKYSDESYSDPTTVLDVPGIPPLLIQDLLAPMKDRGDDAYERFLELSKNVTKSAGVIVNTFERLEHRAVRAITDGHCVASGSPIPPLYCIGLSISKPRPEDQSSESLKWLDSQPIGSVIFISFGSMGILDAAQIKEMAVGLERSGQRFLWVIRAEKSVLPDGFLERTEERGLVVKDWVPQVAVLNHRAVGGLVSHCGWNSVLEAVSAGVPMIGWPLYAEQRQNMVLLVEEMKIALPVNKSEEDSALVSAAEVERRVKELMESKSEVRESLRKRIVALKKEAEVALTPGGSSQLALTRLVNSLVRQ